MHTLETSIILPAVLFFILVAVCISLKYTEVVSKHADKLEASAYETTTNNVDILRGGAILYEIYEEHLS